MTKKKKIIITVVAISIAFIGVVTLALKTDLINKLRSSVIDPVTGDTCTEDTESSNIIHENGQTVKRILDDLYAESNSTCATGYSCNKPTIPTQVEPDSCFTLETNHIFYTLNNQQVTVEDAIKELYRIYNTPGFCPQKYCNPNTYIITLDKNGGTSQGTSKIYEKYDTAIYLNQAETKEMTDSTYPITIPEKVYTITYNANGQGAAFDPNPATSAATFKGYFTESSGGTKLINANGYIIPANFPNNKYHENTTIYAHYTDTAITLPAITKTDATCKWAEGSTSGTEYAGGTSRTISGNTTYYAKCVANPAITVNNYKCPWNYEGDGSDCTKVTADSHTYRKAVGTTETISPASYSGYRAPSSQAVTYNANHTLNFYHTANTPTYTPVSAVYSSSLIRAIHTGDHTDIYISDRSRSHMCTEAAGMGTNYQYFDYTKYDSSTYSGFPYLFPFSDTKYSGSNNLNGVKGTYYIRACAEANSSNCTNAEELRPYIEVKYNLNGGSGTSSKQTKYVGESRTLHGAPSKTGYTFVIWAAQVPNGTQCHVCNGSGGACSTDAYYSPGRGLNDQEWNVGNESWPCGEYDAYENNISTVYLKAIWSRNAWKTYN